MSSLLREQLELYDRQATNWADDYRDEQHEQLVTERKQLCRLLEFGLFLYQQIQRIDQEWGDDVIAPAIGGTTVEPPADIGKLYAWWSKPCGRLLDQIAAFESKGYPLHVASQFRDACANARTKAGWDLARIEAAEEELNGGGAAARPMREVFDELRRRSHPSGG
jgi:hypothetical protein